MFASLLFFSTDGFFPCLCCLVIQNSTFDNVGTTLNTAVTTNRLILNTADHADQSLHVMGAVSEVLLYLDIWYGERPNLCYTHTHTTLLKLHEHGPQILEGVRVETREKGPHFQQPNKRQYS